VAESIFLLSFNHYDVIGGSDYIPSRTVSELLQITGQSFALDRVGLGTLIQGEPLNSEQRNLAV